jgi:starch-binding outer membrane protein, SusD/RagB family
MIQYSKNIKRIVLITGIVFSGLFTSCQDVADDLLTTESPSTVQEEQLFSNFDLAKGAVDGIKISFGEQNSYRGRFLAYYGLNSDSEWLSGLSTEKIDDKFDLCYYDPKANNGQMNTSDNVWAMSYAGIERANLCIQGIRKYGNPVPGSDFGQLLGESLALRAIYYADLLRAFGDIPARFEPINSATIYLPRSNRDIIYKQLIADLGEAETLVAWPNASPLTSTVEKINKSFVKAFRARLALVASGYQQYPDGVRTSTDPELAKDKMYALALKECRDVINSGTVHLESSFETLWRKFNKEDLTAVGEPLWEIPFADGRGRVNYTFAVRHSSIDQWQAMGTDKGGSAGPLPTVFYDFDQADTRRDVTCVPYKYGISDKNGFAKQELGSLDVWYFGKFRFEWMNRRVTSTNDDGVNKIYMRYAEVLLMAAETANEIEGPGAAATYLKEIRKRAFAPADHAVKVDAYVDALTSKDDMFKAIVKENKFEFTGELDRKMALIRWNLLKIKLDEAKQKMNDLAARTGEYVDVPKTLYYKYKADNETLEVYGLNRNETVNPGTDYTSVKWDKLEATKIDALVKPGVNPDENQFWPIWQVFIDASNGKLTN